MSRRPKPVHTVESDDENTSDYDEIKTVELNPVDEINAVAAHKFPNSFSQQLMWAKRQYAFSSIVEPHATSSRRKPSRIAWVKLN